MRERPVEVDAFIEYVRERGQSQRPGPDHEYTAEAIRRLAAALEAMARRAVPPTEVSERLSGLRESVGQLQAKPTSRKHAAVARNAFESAADVFGVFAEHRHPGVEGRVEPLRQAAQGLSASQPLLEQPSVINTFLQRAADTLAAMAGG